MTTPVPRESDLVGHARRGDVGAFEALYRRHVDRVYGLCLRMVADRARAEDLTQEAFLRAWRKLGSFRGRSAFGTWLHRLAVNVVLGDLRAAKRHETKHEPLADEPDEPAAPAAAPPETALDLEAAIAALSPRARQVFVLHDVEGYRHREIAELTGISEGTSKAHLHRARGILRKRLHHDL